jgi:hypothetical protein
MKTLVALAFLVSIVPAWVEADTNPPTQLVPPDGASSIGLTPSLSWTWEVPDCPAGIGIAVFTVYLGTSEESLSPTGLCCNEGWPETVGPLAPGTQYFWQVKVVDELYDCPGSHEALSALQSFTTAAPVPVQEAAWQQVKVLYR